MIKTGFCVPATVSQLGVGTLSTKEIGETKITAAMTRAAHNKAQVERGGLCVLHNDLPMTKHNPPMTSLNIPSCCVLQGRVVVEPAVSLELLDSQLEFLVGDQIVLPLALFHKNKEMFSR